MSSSIRGIQSVIHTHSQRAERLTRAAEAEGVEKDLAELPSDPSRLAAQGKAIKTQDKMLGDLLDILA